MKMRILVIRVSRYVSNKTNDYRVNVTYKSILDKKNEWNTTTFETSRLIFNIC